MKNLIFKFIAILFLLTPIHQASAESGFGINLGTGLPYVGQVGLNYVASDKLSFYAGYNILDLEIDSASASLSMPEVGVLYHPFSKAFFIGLGLGQQSLEVTATDDFTNQEVRADVDSTNAIAKVGWMWGKNNGGFWFGVDFAYVAPLSSDVSITAPGVPVTDQDYIDVVDAANQFGETAYINITFARLGYIF